MGLIGKAVQIVNGRPLGYLTTKEFGEQMGVTDICVRTWIKRGKLKALKIGSDNWIREGTPVSGDHRLERRKEESVEAWHKLTELYLGLEAEHLEVLIGAILRGDVRMLSRKIIFSGGPGTGKSTLIRILEAVLAANRNVEFQHDADPSRLPLTANTIIAATNQDCPHDISDFSTIIFSMTGERLSTEEYFETVNNITDATAIGDACFNTYWDMGCVYGF